ncbi:DUF4199 domain-containing protein [Flavobacterium chuncheonense]|uniref:DUF4199 domain-containing protein n=1 Tax=Flavobacterium chuncheonense TaxID=2026653 RepID=A0ABW5YJ77_9FLAO
MNEIIKKNGVKFGLITGIVVLLINLMLYLIDLKLFISTWISAGLFLFYFIISLLVFIQTKKDLGGFISLKEGFTAYFLSIVIGFAISISFNIILFNLIDPEAKETIKELGIEAFVNMMRKFGTPNAQLKEMATKMEEQDQFAVGSQIMGYGINLLFGAIYGVILAAIFKKDKPVF